MLENVSVVLLTLSLVRLEEVVLQLISTKCVPALKYGLEALPLNKSELSSLDFVVNRLFMKLFKSTNIQFIIECQTNFGFKLPSELWVKRCHKFNNKFGPTDQFCGLQL